MNAQRFELAKKVLIECGKRLRRADDEKLCAFEKTSNQDVLSIYDVQIEKYITGEILKQFPHDRFVGEELGQSGQSENIWYIDPIDGTANFVHLREHYAISVAFYAGDRPVFGLVLDPFADKLYAAYIQKGAYCNEKRIQTVSNTLQESFLYCPWISKTFFGSEQQAARELAGAVRAVRSLGCVALELCLIAEGKADIFLTAHSNPWDHNAARIILTEAGGAICTPSGEALNLHESTAVLAVSGEQLLQEVLTNLKR